MSWRHIGDFNPPMSRDFRLLSDYSQGGYYSPMEKFRSALLRRLEETGFSLKKISDDADVSYEQLKKLKQIEDRSTNVDDAIKIANTFGMTVNQFVSDEKYSSRNRIIALLQDLSPDALDLLVDFAKVRSERTKATEKSSQADQ